MVQLIVGEKGEGKTKFLLDKVNTEVKDAHGSIVYLDKNPKHMYELNNKIRLIVVPDYMVDSSDAFLGFVSGIISQDHDLEQMYFDSFLKIANLEGQNIEPVVAKLEQMSEKFGVEIQNHCIHLRRTYSICTRKAPEDLCRGLFLAGH